MISFEVLEYKPLRSGLYATGIQPGKDEGLKVLDYV